MHNLFLVLGFFSIFIGSPALVVLMIVDLKKRKPVKKLLKTIPIVFVFGMFSTFIGVYLYGQTDEYKESQLKKESEKQTETVLSSEEEVTNNIETTYKQEETTEQKQTEIETTTQEITTEVETEQQTTALTEEGYKDSCKELFYDDVFFGKENLEGQNVKIHLFLSEKYYFTADDMYKDSFKEFNSKYNLNRDFFKCCVLRKDAASYVGKQISMFFSDDISLSPSNYQTGQKVIVYAEVISWSNNTWDGYNSVIIIPKYMEGE